MANSISMIPTLPFDTFSIVRCADQNYAEIETEFVERQKFHLPDTWQVIKDVKDNYCLQFNNEYGNPLILNKGWEEFKKYFTLPKNVEIVLDYYGSGVFAIKTIKELTLKSQLPAFHSKSQIPNKTTCYEVTLMPMNYNGPKLKPLPMDFASFLQKFDYITLCGRNGMTMPIGVYRKNDLHRIRLGPNWDNFSMSQQFKAGDEIRFKFEVKDDGSICNRCHVFKVYVDIATEASEFLPST
ncbi:hypothetical protein TSUD_131910 [Trifolium subterraneum]|uniref:TF-B3 domain-containing protein n=1 Tax=Trifolium subterraneum TaxID=3900 RepID=A0A2Z6LK65_TRISU|nr:hypothetical protein TSUD_131910 [Trifolium subterraneum]